MTSGSPPAAAPTPVTLRRIAPASLERVLGHWSTRGPAYTALAEAVRLAVLSGTLAPGTRLPSERDLAEHLGLSRTTATAAYGVLRDQGYLVSRRGAGSVVTRPARRRADAAPAGEQAWRVELSMTAPRPPAALHAALAAASERLPAHLDGPPYEGHGVLELREAIAERYTRRGVPTSPDEVLVTTGAQHALHLLFGLATSPGDRVVVEHPTYPNAVRTLTERGVRPVPVPMTPAGVDVDLLESTVRQSSPRLLYVIPDHHNPTGASLDAAARERVADLGRRHRTLVVADETLTDLRLDGPELPAFAASAPRTPTLACVGSASKAFWAGLRLGGVRAPRDLVDRLAVARGTSDIAPAVLDQLVLLELLRHEDDVLGPLRAELRENRDHLRRLLAERFPSWRVPRPDGGMVLWADLGAPASTALAALAGRQGIRLAPGTAFSVDGSFDQFLRLPYSAPVEVLEEAVDVLVDAWAALEGPTYGGAELPVV